MCVLAGEELCTGLISGCSLDCSFGFQTDAHNCEICQCRPRPKKCKPIVCDKYCPFGYLYVFSSRKHASCTPVYGKYAKVQAYPLGFACGTAGGSRKIKTSLRMWECSILQNWFGSTHLETEAQKWADYKRKAVLKFCWRIWQTRWESYLQVKSLTCSFLKFFWHALRNFHFIAHLFYSNYFLIFQISFNFDMTAD